MLLSMLIEVMVQNSKLERRLQVLEDAEVVNDERVDP